jgi:hypothetical protein
LLDQPLILYRQHSHQQIGAARLSLGRQVELARQMDRRYFERQAECSLALRDRLLAIRPFLRRGDFIDLVRARIKHQRARARMRDATRLGRLPAVLKELWRLRYHRCGFGLKSLAADLLL